MVINMINNRQLRNWVFMLYPDNPKHSKAIDLLDLMDNSIYIKHVAKFNDDGEIINKEHYHCILKFDNPYWLSKLLLDLGLSDEDAHLFHSVQDFKKYKNLDQYIDYLDHVNTDKIDKYKPDDFKGGLSGYALKIINNRDLDSYMMFNELVNWIRDYNLKNFADCRMYTFTDWFNAACHAGFGKLFYKEWYKLRDILRSYINE